MLLLLLLLLFFAVEKCHVDIVGSSRFDDVMAFVPVIDEIDEMFWKRL